MMTWLDTEKKNKKIRIRKKLIFSERMGVVEK